VTSRPISRRGYLIPSHTRQFNCHRSQLDKVTVAIQDRSETLASSVVDLEGARTSAVRLNFTRNTPDRPADGIRRLHGAMQRYLAARSKGGA